MKNISSKIWKNIPDSEYINGLKRGDSRITEAFFYGMCNYMLNDIKFSVTKGLAHYDELVNELFIYLSKDNWHKLDTFAGLNGCSLCSWTTRIAWRFFLKQKEFQPGNLADITETCIADTANDINAEVAMDVKSTFGRMTNKRYVQVLQWMLVDGYNATEVARMLGTTTANVYNLKHRAIVNFIEVYNA